MRSERDVTAGIGDDEDPNGSAFNSPARKGKGKGKGKSKGPGKGNNKVGPAVGQALASQVAPSSDPMTPPMTSQLNVVLNVEEVTSSVKDTPPTKEVDEDAPITNQHGLHVVTKIQQKVVAVERAVERLAKSGKGRAKSGVHHLGNGAKKTGVDPTDIWNARVAELRYTPIFPNSLPHFRLYEVVSLHMCFLP